MSRVKQGLNKTSTIRIKRLSKQIKTDYVDVIECPDLFIEGFKNFLTFEVRAQRTCSEKNVVDYAFDELYKVLNTKSISLPYDGIFETIKNSVRSRLSSHYTSKTFDNNIDIYFNDVKREYIKCPQIESQDLEFCEENRDIFIKNNLKLVISTAKQYQDMGLPFEDLIQIGNLGLLTAFEKFNPQKNNLRDGIKKLLSESLCDTFTYDEAVALIKDGFVYDDNLEKTLKKLPPEGFTSKDEFERWINKNIKEAVFASVAFMWIRAYIINELDRTGKIIRVPKIVNKKTPKNDSLSDFYSSDLYSDDYAENLKSNPLTIINLDSVNPYTNDCYHDDELSQVTSDEFIFEDEALENEEKRNTFKELVNNALYKLPDIDRRIIKKRFGIDMPYELSLSEIAESEGMSANKVKYSISKSLETIANSFNTIDKETILSLL